MYFTTCLRIIYRLSKKYYRLFKNLAFYYRFPSKTNKKPSEKIFQTAFYNYVLLNKLRPTSRVCLLSNHIECP